MEEEFLEFVANILHVEKSEISLSSKYRQVRNWDSIMMLTLVMEIEEKYGVSIPIESLEKDVSLEEIFKYTIS